MKLPLKPDPETLSIPSESKCLICGVSIGEPGEFIRLATGAMLYSDASRKFAGPSELMDTVFSLWYHGAHPVEGKTDDKRDIIGMNNPEVWMDIVERVSGGQVELHFCSAKCLRGFFEAVVDRFEEDIANAKEPNNAMEGVS